MNLTFLLLFWSLGVGWIAGLPAQAVAFDDYFLPRTLRIDVHHGGTAEREFFSIDAIREEPVWAGPRKGLVTPFDRGRYQIRVHDLESGRLIFARGYSCVFGEWQTTAEAKKGRRVFTESRSIPYPCRPVRVTFLVRDAKNAFAPVFACHIDPGAVTVRRDPPRRDIPLINLLENGPPAAKVDLAVVAEGYTTQEMDLFEADARRLIKHFFSYEPYRSRKADFNVTLVCAPSTSSGIDEPTRKLFRRSAAEASFNSFLLPRYVLVEDFTRLRDLASGVPHDLLIVLINSDRYGGGGIYNWYMTATARNDWSGYVFVHEFGHAFAGLADEYYSSRVAYEDFYPAGTEPWSPNITRLGGGADARANLKWKDLVEPEVPVPTPWPQEQYDSLEAKQSQGVGGEKTDKAEKKNLARDRRKLLRESPFFGKVGAFEGGGYVAKGMYRPYLECIMFSKAMVPYCPVCRRALDRMIIFLAGH